MPPPQIVWDFADASLDFRRKFPATFTPEATNWQGRAPFCKQMIMP